MPNIFHIIVALLTYQTGCWLLQSSETGNFGYFHFALTIGIGMLTAAQLFLLADDFVSTTTDWS